MISLNKVVLDKDYRILEIQNELEIKRRLMDMGIVPGVYIKKVLENPFGGICAYYVMDTVVAIRDGDARGIVVDNEEI